MPRLSPRALDSASRLHPLLPLLLPQCRSLDLARNELRWLRERVLSAHTPGWRSRLWSMCRLRSRGMPLQYILGDQPFGDLEILCRQGVLIPRPETETYSFHTAELVRKNILRRGGPPDSDSPASERPLRVLDLCTGTGCIALLLHALLAPHYPHMAVLGVDLSTAAIELANRNLEHNLQRGLLSSRARSEVHFRRGNVLGDQSSGVPGVEEVLRDVSLHGCPSGSWDVLISNPPYISPSSFRDGTTARSVRIFEPTLALVPPTGARDPEARNRSQGDLFYHRIVALSFKLRPRLTVLECGDRVQAECVVAICRGFMEGLSDRSHIEVYPSADEGDVSQACAVILTRRVGQEHTPYIQEQSIVTIQ